MDKRGALLLVSRDVGGRSRVPVFVRRTYVAVCHYCQGGDSVVFCGAHNVHMCFNCLRAHLWTTQMFHTCVFVTAETNPEVFSYE